MDMLTPVPGVLLAAPSDPRDDTTRAETQAALAADALARTGHDVRWSVSHGGPAHEILVAAQAFESELVVMGSRGLTGLSRLVLGSVARNVLLHAHTSVLIVHEPLRAEEKEPVEAPARVEAAMSG
jgi:nucleotide-binding universal stress UspA family protein